MDLVDLHLLLGAQIAGCFFFYVSTPALFLVSAASAGGFIARFVQNRDSIPRLLVLIIYMTWVFWVMWNSLLQASAQPWFVSVPFSMAQCVFGVYLSKHENSSFNAYDQRAQMYAATVLVLGMVPLNFTRNESLAWGVTQLVAQSATYTLYFYGLHLFRANSNFLSLFAFSYWVLTSDCRVGITLACINLLMSKREKERQEQAEPDVEEGKQEVKQETVVKMIKTNDRKPDLSAFKQATY